ncbi:hypothetical protein EMGBS4_16560 [Acidimicrobiaceae bacterium]|nr:hypothetical protein EMGBS4_16560 [Acidimicrobiaceae bacterium]
MVAAACDGCCNRGVDDQLGFLANQSLPRKTDFNATVKQRIGDPIVSVEKLLGAINNGAETPETVEWRTVLVVGEYIDAETVEAVNRAQGGYSGKDPLTPIRLADNQLLLINRGFIPLAKEIGPAPSGQVQIIGRVRAPEVRRRFRISDPTQGELAEVSNIDLERLNKQMPSELAPIFVEVLESKPADSPVCLKLRLLRCRRARI